MTVVCSILKLFVEKRCLMPYPARYRSRFCTSSRCEGSLGMCEFQSLYLHASI